MLKLFHRVERSGALGSQLVQLQNELANKTHYATKLEDLLRSRTERIDELANVIAVLREQNRRLSEEADHLCELVRQA
jgi:hypothetical protein